MDYKQNILDLYNILTNDTSLTNDVKNARSYLEKYFIESNETHNQNVMDMMNEIIEYENSKDDVFDSQTLQKNINNISIWKGDITKLKIDAIVNAANSGGLGCFAYGHKCIDNVIHTKAGPSLRQECRNVMKQLDIKKVTTSNLIITSACLLPSKYILHVVGPIYKNHSISENNELLKACYINCLDGCRINNITSIAFCCVSTGLFGFPKDSACKIAIESVNEWMNKNPDYVIHVVFCIYSDKDYDLYKNEISIC